MDRAFVTVEGRSDPAGPLSCRPVDSPATPMEGADMPLNLGAVRALGRTALRRLDAWTLTTLNADGRRPRLG